MAAAEQVDFELDAALIVNTLHTVQPMTENMLLRKHVKQHNREMTPQKLSYVSKHFQLALSSSQHRCKSCDYSYHSFIGDVNIFAAKREYAEADVDDKANVGYLTVVSTYFLQPSYIPSTYRRHV